MPTPEPMVPDKLWYRIQTVLLGAIGSHVLPGRGSVMCGELQAGGKSICYVLLECSYDSTEGHHGQHAYTFVIRILKTSLYSVSLSAAALGIYLYGADSPLPFL
jgi:hypothetical protein